MKRSDTVHVIERCRHWSDQRMLLAARELEDPEVLDGTGVRFFASDEVEGDHVPAYDCGPWCAEEYAD